MDAGGLLDDLDFKPAPEAPQDLSRLLRPPAFYAASAATGIPDSTAHGPEFRRVRRQFMKNRLGSVGRANGVEPLFPCGAGRIAPSGPG